MIFQVVKKKKITRTQQAPYHYFKCLLLGRKKKHTLDSLSPSGLLEAFHLIVTKVSTTKRIGLKNHERLVLGTKIHKVFISYIDFTKLKISGAAK